MPQRVGSVARVPTRPIFFFTKLYYYKTRTILLRAQNNQNGSIKSHNRDAKVPYRETRRRSGNDANEADEWKLHVHHEQARSTQRGRRQVHRLLLPAVSTATHSRFNVLSVDWRIAAFGSFVVCLFVDGDDVKVYAVVV